MKRSRIRTPLTVALAAAAILPGTACREGPGGDGDAAAGRDTARGHVRHLQPAGLVQNPVFTPVVVAEGPRKTIYVGGQNAVDSTGTVVGKGDVAAQTEQALRNLERALASAGAGLEHIVKWTVYAVEGEPAQPAVAAFRKVWGDRPNPPAITVLYVSGLAHPDFLVEIDATAVLPE